MDDKPNTTGPVPDFFTLEEAAAILRIGRTTIYALARRFEATGGVGGLPVWRCGKQYRVPRYALEAILGGPITWPLATSHTPTTLTPPPASPERVSRTRSRSASRREPTPRLFTA